MNWIEVLYLINKKLLFLINKIALIAVYVILYLHKHKRWMTQLFLLNYKILATN